MKDNIIIVLILLLASCGERPQNATQLADQPPIFPDYAGVTIPACIAPLNFNLEGDPAAVYVNVKGSKSGEMHTSGKYADFNVKDWHTLTAQNVGAELIFDVYAKDKSGKWFRYQPFSIHVSPTPLDDYGVVYRKIAPGYQTFSKIGIYQRELYSFKETPVIEETAVNGQCLNCHYANRGSADQFTIHVRGNNGGTILKDGDNLSYIDTKSPDTKGNATYGYWHPEGRYIAYSVNKIVQNFHLDKQHNIEPWDVFSDLMVFDTQTGKVITSSIVATSDCETTPAFSPDGKKIFFCRADSVDMPNEYNKLKYSLCSIDFDAQKGEFGSEITTIISADSIGMSVSLPRPSYDGRFLMYNLTEYGTSPIHHADADLWILDLASGKSRRMDEINSEYSDAYHNWSPDGNGWFLFSSKRIDGMYANLYLSCVDSLGNATKPFLLPQKNPKKYYSSSLHSFNAPDFTSSKITLK